jgi:hypothetical protein
MKLPSQRNKIQFTSQSLFMNSHGLGIKILPAP